MSRRNVLFRDGGVVPECCYVLLESAGSVHHVNECLLQWIHQRVCGTSQGKAPLCRTLARADEVGIRAPDRDKTMSKFGHVPPIPAGNLSLRVTARMLPHKRLEAQKGIESTQR
jgi:hypothetical protein